MTVWHRGGDFDSSLATTSAGGSAEGRAVGRSLSGGRVESEIWRWNRHANHQQPPGNDDRNKTPEEMNSDDVSHRGGVCQPGRLKATARNLPISLLEVTKLEPVLLCTCAYIIKPQRATSPEIARVGCAFVPCGETHKTRFWRVRVRCGCCRPTGCLGRWRRSSRSDRICVNVHS